MESAVLTQFLDTSANVFFFVSFFSSRTNRNHMKTIAEMRFKTLLGRLPEIVFLFKTSLASLGPPRKERKWECGFTRHQPDERTGCDARRSVRWRRSRHIDRTAAAALRLSPSRRADASCGSTDPVDCRKFCGKKGK